ncbi:hypothetical protein DFQ04_0038 [Algoriphagus boseongensis]|uniref:Uncharacterized protein n=1 Tax=Algoriphagus boseongensis TaxID=1442587 RepID=A0A4R6T5R1_9BACT|nr:hypothetical protein DFQ04_0038 [Algoriphagus boseongensis]
MNIRNLKTRQVIGSIDCGYSSTDHRRQSTAPQIRLHIYSHLVPGSKADNPKIKNDRISFSKKWGLPKEQTPNAFLRK